MIACMKHESFYKSGVYVNEELGVYAGWTSHPESYTDCLPAMSENKDVILLFAGEDFSNYTGSQPRRADSLVRRYENEGENFLRGLNGWFSGLLIDLKSSKILLFNDRYGMQRIYYHEEPETLLFGSEAKSILKVRPQLRDLDPRGLGELIACNCVLEHRTLFPKIFLLPGASLWRWNKNDRMLKDAYFNQAEWENLPPLDEATFQSRLTETAMAIIPRYFREKGEVGLSLTGGLDSRMIIACLNPAPGEVPCYTFGGQRDMLDITIARKVAKICGQTHTVVRIGPSFFDEFPKLAEKTIYISDGNLDVSSTHDLYFNRLAREIASIRVTGKFGSEVIRDHTMFNAGASPGGIFHQDVERSAGSAVETLAEVKCGHKLSVAVFKDFPWREYNKIMIEGSSSVFRTPYMDNDLVELMYQIPAGGRSSNQPQRRIIKGLNPALSVILSDRGYGEQSNTLAGKIRELYYYAIFKAEYTYVYALPHWLSKLDHLCLAVNGGQPLIGASQKFEYYRIWYGQQLSDYVKSVLLDPKAAARAFFDKNRLEMIVHAHTTGRRNCVDQITKALSLELTCRLLVDR